MIGKNYYLFYSILVLLYKLQVYFKYMARKKRQKKKKTFYSNFDENQRKLIELLHILKLYFVCNNLSLQTDINYYNRLCILYRPDFPSTTAAHPRALFADIFLKLFFFSSKHSSGLTLLMCNPTPVYATIKRLNRARPAREDQ